MTEGTTMYEEYEELVRLLKDKAERFDYDGWVDTAVVMEKAADAIEKLIEVIQNHDFLESLIKPRWISVTKRPPDESGNYLTAFGDGTAMAVNEFMHPRNWLTEEGRKANPNGKWYWGGVTHWMPLPEPPKENGKSET